MHGAAVYCRQSRFLIGRNQARVLLINSSRTNKFGQDFAIVARRCKVLGSDDWLVLITRAPFNLYAQICLKSVDKISHSI
jgi:hypothetical protein